MERDAKGKPTKFEEGDKIEVAGKNFTVGPTSAEVLNLGLKTRLGVEPPRRIREEGQVSLIPTEGSSREFVVFPLKQVLEETGAIDKPEET